MPFTLTRTQQFLIAALFAGSLLALITSNQTKSEQTVTKPVLPDFTQFTDVKAKKSAFFDYMLPYVQQANAEIMAERQKIKTMDFKNPSSQAQTAIQALLKKYRIDATDITPEVQQALLKKVDIISPSLALAQAANESSWGTSRFAKEAYNFYGQWCFTRGCGLVPNQRSAGMVHEVKTFKSPYESVKGYMLNLNSHPYFKPLREQRLIARQTNQPPTGYALASGLIRYSERKEEYIKEIRAMIRSNKLYTLDRT
ncbi:MAG: glucosaminidase domain-containing protein [Thiotrichales bacterium]|nr:glucosaminidase domain-containing protein [Thiotrichales bacterium]